MINRASFKNNEFCSQLKVTKGLSGALPAETISIKFGLLVEVADIFWRNDCGKCLQITNRHDTKSTFDIFH